MRTKALTIGPAKPHGERTGYFNKARITRHFDSKSLRVTKTIWSARITAQYRAIGERRGEIISWVWIGTHNDFDKLFG